ncbi:hypothetical protein P152DRAFT_458177 [Eremomyces bilateralis CBS 781.70]|uniref:B-related factor 1 n=1 Tax=Eremomyces bilateralis CBS 781.70 TaxID=1392243 RepID=A0A6G1G4K8_9PEZI|nr:uncharacterized protein P152DRAFT_458177 [Eremomyces bilateralis CBS 781.70]KAF1813007.1 hypothetical protein P152DRAFT_458177 [Eremomyces bilateralis CBS 781.70]
MSTDAAQPQPRRIPRFPSIKNARPRQHRSSAASAPHGSPSRDPTPPSTRGTLLPTPGASRDDAAYNQAPPPKKPNNSGHPATSQPCPECGEREVIEHDGEIVCTMCGTKIADANIVADVMFGETSTGAAVVQGGFVGESQRYAKTMGTAFRKVGGGTDSREQSMRIGRDEITRLAAALNLHAQVESAVGIYSLAHTNGFIQGRRTSLVAAVCLYAVCRRDNKHDFMMLEFAEKLKINVYVIGDTYKALVKKLYLFDYENGSSNDKKEFSPILNLVPLIEKFAGRLEFKDSYFQVVSDASLILSRFKQDWMVTGRTPAGLIGACIILAARMNNFRRTVREVVYVVKSSDATILSRLLEFQNTVSSKLNVDQFRQYADKLKIQHNPPAIQKSKEKSERLEKLKRKRQGEVDQDEVQQTIEAAEMLTQSSSSSSSSSSSTAAQKAVKAKPGRPKGSKTKRTKESEPSRKKRKLDKDGFLIPPLPTPASSMSVSRSATAESAHDAASQTEDDMDRAPTPMSLASDLSMTVEEAFAVASVMTNEAAGPKLPGRKKRKRSDEDRVNIIINDEDLIDENDTLERDIEEYIPELFKFSEDLITSAATRAKVQAEHLRGTSSVLDSTEIGEDEFEDDPEVANCLLSEPEIRVKERVWVTHNKEWMLAQAKKMIQKELEEREMAENGGKRLVKRRRKMGRMGDGSVLEGGKPVTNATEASARMLAKHSKNFLSKHVHWDKLMSIYGGDEEARAPSVTSGAPSVAAGEAGEPGQAAVGIGRHPDEEILEEFASDEEDEEEDRRPAAKGDDEEEEVEESGEEEDMGEEDEEVYDDEEFY